MDQLYEPRALPHDNQAHVLISTVIAVLITAVVSVSLRIYTRACIIGRLGTDDCLLLLALVLAIATGVSECINTTNGLGTHYWDLGSHEEAIAYSKNFYVSIVFYNSGLMATKMTFMVQYYRVLVMSKFRIVCIVAMVAVGAWSLSQILIGIFLCKPIAGFWDASLNAKCIPLPLQWYVNAGGNIITDIIIFILPLPVLTRLDLPKMQKISLVGIFSLGFFTCAISVIRLKFLRMGSDFTYDNIEASIWSITELCSGVTCASLTMLRPLLSKCIPKLSSTCQRSLTIPCVPHFDCHTTIASKHSREASRDGSSAYNRSENGLRHSDAHANADDRTSGDDSGNIRDFDATRGSPSRNTMHMPARERPSTNRLPGWTCPSVTSTISSGNRHSCVSHETASAINVTRDIKVQSFPQS
ncbi:hypothetical protein F5Y03DRAFT_409007 [Xylaria venustula]|nr:hypothetical protein F5Y03DRAFT_409007 [Xylaria venustula]